MIWQSRNIVYVLWVTTSLWCWSCAQTPPHREKGLVTIEHFLGCTELAVSIFEWASSWCSASLVVCSEPRLLTQYMATTPQNGGLCKSWTCGLDYGPRFGPSSGPMRSSKNDLINVCSTSTLVKKILMHVLLTLLSWIVLRTELKSQVTCCQFRNNIYIMSIYAESKRMWLNGWEHLIGQY